MKTFFSKRHSDAIRDKKLPLTFSQSLRTSIVQILNRFSDYGGFDYDENSTSDYAVNALKMFYGKEHLEAFNEKGKRTPASFDQVILNGYPSEVVDCVEAWFAQESKEADRCERELNDLLSMNRSPWRFVNGEAILVDSEFLHQEVRARTLRLLKEVHALGAMEEFQEAIQDLQSGNAKDAIVKAHKSVESVMKVVLGKDEQATFGVLLAELIKSSVLPDYYEEFLKHFEKLALGAVKERNLPGRGHGQGTSVKTVPPSLAEFAINLAGSINLFLIQRWLETKKKTEKPAP